MQCGEMISSYEEIELKGEKLLLLPQKVIVWPEQKLLLIADLHLGKTSHYRNNGIAVPANSSLKNWKLLHQVFRQPGVERVIFLGDLFHSTFNKEWEVFGELIGAYDHLQFELVLGNHDILEPVAYEKLGFKIHFQPLLVDPFLLSHEPLPEDSTYYNLAGHIHPGVRLRGKGRQSHKTACFYFGENGGILPAFGTFTGVSVVPVKKDDQVFVVVNRNVIPIT
jgi:DNA ligase-associated metallophosphoesterase